MADVTPLPPPGGNNRSVFAALGAGEPDAYLRGKLSFKESRSEGDQNIEVSPTMLQLLFRWVGVTFASSVLALVVALLLALVRWWMADAGAALADQRPALSVLWFVLWWAFAAMPRRLFVGRWEVLVSDAAMRGADVYATIAAALQSRGVPADVTRRTIISDTEGRRDTLVVTRRRFAAYMSVFPFGTGLYVSWAMWREQSFLSMCWAVVVKVVRRSIGHSDELALALQGDSARALREALHLAAREGVEAAYAARTPSGGSTFDPPAYVPAFSVGYDA